MKKVEQLIDSVAEYGGVAASAGIGALIGTAIAGPAGSVGGALIGTVAERTILKIGQEIKDRCLSTSEVRKIGSVYDCVKEKINENLTVGKPLRNDDFFDESFGDRSSSDEILEGVLFAAQRESEEKKLTYIKWQKHEDFMKIGIPCSKQKAGHIVCPAFTDFNVYPTSTSLIVMVPMGINSKL